MSMSDVTLMQNDGGTVAPNQIEAVLQALWRDSTGEEAEAAVVQVRTLNLLVFVPQAQASTELMNTIGAVSVQHPGRSITMLATEGSQPPSAYATIACRYSENGKQICGDQITISSGEQGAPLPSITASLLVAGVPTFLWWLGDPPFESPVFAAFVESADRVIVDSRSWDRPLETLAALAQAVRKNAPYSAFTDLQWTTIIPWRRLTAQCFDMRDARPELDRLQQVRIEHGAELCDRVAALLFLGWLTSRLGWTMVEVDGDAVTLRSAAGSIAVTLASRAGERGLCNVQLSSAEASFKLMYQRETNHIQTEIMLPGCTPIERMARLDGQPLERMLTAELNLLERDAGYEAALQVAAQLAAASD